MARAAIQFDGGHLRRHEGEASVCELTAGEERMLGQVLDECLHLAGALLSGPGRRLRIFDYVQSHILILLP
jgi:hypothetical protein